jgi:hypothetical protein
MLKFRHVSAGRTVCSLERLGSVKGRQHGSPILDLSPKNSASCDCGGGMHKHHYKGACYEREVVLKKRRPSAF